MCSEWENFKCQDCFPSGGEGSLYRGRHRSERCRRIRVRVRVRVRVKGLASCFHHRSPSSTRPIPGPRRAAVITGPWKQCQEVDVVAGRSNIVTIAMLLYYINGSLTH